MGRRTLRSAGSGDEKRILERHSDEILKPGLDAGHADRVPLEVEVEIGEGWGDR